MIPLPTLNRPLLALCAAVLLALTDTAYADAPFVVNDDGTVTDTSTGLIWDQCVQGLSGSDCASGTAATYTWTEALGQAATQSQANYKGYANWRLPSVVELKTLIKDRGLGVVPKVDIDVFPATPVFYTWSASLYVYNTDLTYPYMVDFATGLASYIGNLNHFHVRLVRSGQFFGSFALLPGTAISAIAATTAILSATSPVAATGYWLAVPRNATPPTPPQVIVGADYGGVVVKAGSGAMAAKTATSFSLAGLAAGTAYDLYVLAREGDYSTNSVLTGPLQFTTAAIAGSATRSVLIDPDTGTTLYAAVDGAGVYVSADSGSTWTVASTQPGNLYVKALAKRSGTPQYAGTYGGGVFKTGTADTIFAACDSQPGNLNVLSLALDANGNLYAGTEAGVYVSSDACATWTAANNGLP